MNEYLIEFYGQDLDTGRLDNHTTHIMADSIETLIDTFFDTMPDYMEVISFKIYLRIGEAVQREGDLYDTDRQSN